MRNDSFHSIQNHVLAGLCEISRSAAVEVGPVYADRCIHADGTADITIAAIVVVDGVTMRLTGHGGEARAAADDLLRRVEEE